MSCQCTGHEYYEDFLNFLCIKVISDVTPSAILVLNACATLSFSTSYVQKLRCLTTKSNRLLPQFLAIPLPMWLPHRLIFEQPCSQDFLCTEKLALGTRLIFEMSAILQKRLQRVQNYALSHITVVCHI